jgi:sterol desaturase/sphingolipid hydroxylase (fatty acid hydroxylase superfamily)
MYQFGRFSKAQWPLYTLELVGAACLGATVPLTAYLTGLTIEKLATFQGGDTNARKTVHIYSLWFEILAIITVFTGLKWLHICFHFYRSR